MVKRDWKFITLLFVLFFMTVFFHGCDSTEWDPIFGSSAEYAIGFPFAYVDLGSTISFQGNEFIWWALLLNIGIFVLMYKYIHIIAQNLFFKTYTYILVGIHILFSLTLLFGDVLYGSFNSSSSNTSFFMLALIFSLVLILLAYRMNPNKTKTLAEINKRTIIKKSLLIIGILLLVPSIMYISPFFHIAYMFTLGAFGEFLTDYVPILGSGVTAFIVLWLPAFLFFLIKKKNSSAKENGETISNNKPSLKKKTT